MLRRTAVPRWANSVSPTAAFEVAPACLPAATTAAATPGLLPYRIRRAAASELLYGGVRATGLIPTPPPVYVTRSESTRLPTKEEHWKRPFAWESMTTRMSPINLNVHAKALVAYHKSVDLARRHTTYGRLPQGVEEEEQAAADARGSADTGAVTQTGEPRYHKHPSALRVESVNPETWAALPEAKRRFTPLQSMKPMTNLYRASARHTGGRTQHMTLVMERLNGSGFGEKKTQRDMWDHDKATFRDRPRMYWKFEKRY